MTSDWKVFLDSLSPGLKALRGGQADVMTGFSAIAKAALKPGALDAMTKELIYIAVSAANGCEYCVHSHTAAARAKGMTDAQHAELLAVIGMASQTNALVNTLQVPVDEAFKK